MDLDDDEGIELLFKDDTTARITREAYRVLYPGEPTFPMTVRITYTEEGVVVEPFAMADEQGGQ